MGSIEKPQQMSQLPTKQVENERKGDKGNESPYTVLEIIPE